MYVHGTRRCKPRRRIYMASACALALTKSEKLALKSAKNDAKCVPSATEHGFHNPLFNTDLAICLLHLRTPTPYVSMMILYANQAKISLRSTNDKLPENWKFKCVRSLYQLKVRCPLLRMISQESCRSRAFCQLAAPTKDHHSCTHRSRPHAEHART